MGKTIRPDPPELRQGRKAATVGGRSVRYGSYPFFMYPPDFLNRCLELARMGSSKVYPNPRVGAVIAHNGQIIGEGFHPFSGGPHGEVSAYQSVSELHLLPESTLYVSLEPCNHFGKTPPCTDLILKTGIPRVVVGCLDPNPKVAGKGITRLRQHGVEVILADDPAPFAALNAPFFINQQQKRPYIVLKWAQSPDGFIAGLDIAGNPQSTPITGKETRRKVHQLRAWHHAIMVGRKTAAIDNPRLNTRVFYGQDPIRIVLDRQQQLNPDLHLLQDKQATIVLNQQQQSISGNKTYHIPTQWTPFPALISSLYTDLGICSILVEGGKHLLQQFLDTDLYDELFVFEGGKELRKGVSAPVIPTGLSSGQIVEIGPDQLFHVNRKRYQIVGMQE